MREAGRKLKEARERLKLTYRDVTQASARIAERRGSPEFAIALSRLADIENKGTMPSLHRLYTLCAIYRLDLSRALSWYGVKPEDLAADSAAIQIGATSLMEFEPKLDDSMTLPLDPEELPDLRQTTFLSRLVRSWGKMPLAMLKGLDWKKYRYGFIGAEDWFMYPLLPPGSLVLIDESRRRIASGGWNSEWDRPVYFFELRDGYACGWAAVSEGRLILQPHPASRCPARSYAFTPESREIEVVGRVAGVAMRLDLSARRRARF